jgi:hypothetical protein
MTGRPVNIQASREFVMQFRGDVLGQPYLTLIDAASGSPPPPSEPTDVKNEGA